MSVNGSTAYFHLLAEYNASANERLYDSCATLSDRERKKDRDAFFRSIHGTLNHIMIGDRIWLSRFRGETVPSTGLDEILFDDFDGLRKERREMDRRITDFVNDLEPSFLETEITYVNNEGHRYDDPVHLLSSPPVQPSNSPSRAGPRHDLPDRRGRPRAGHAPGDQTRSGRTSPLALVLYTVRDF